MLPKLPLGQDGPAISTIGLGCMGMSEFYGESDDAQSIAIIHHALELGINFFDTSDMYGLGHNESLLQRALKDRRDKAVIATKFGIVREPGTTSISVSGKPEYVAEACDNSLKRLGVDVIDLYYQHRVDPDTPIEETVGAMSRLVEAGKVRYLGLSEAAPETIKRAAAVHPIAALQTELSLWSREPEAELMPLCQSLGITFVAYSPLSRGLLTGQFRSSQDLEANDFRRHLPRFAEGNLEKNIKLVEKVEALAKARNCTPAQIALAWVLNHPQTVTIPGTRKLHRLQENAAAAQVALSPEELAELNAIAPPGAAAGMRYPEERMHTVNR